MTINSNSWPFLEAKSLIERMQKFSNSKGYVLFETGYGPSGLPHIGTFGEVARTTFIRRAFTELTSLPSRLVAFSDDMDGLRRVPTNVPNSAMLEEYLGKPLTAIPDPFGKYASFGEHNNNKLQEFLDHFGFEYEFKSATECYRSGVFDDTIIKILENYDAITKVVLPTLGAERQATYSPFLPICPKTGKVLQVAVVKRDLNKRTISFYDEDGDLQEVLVTGGHCKLQWKVDWALRWVALGVDYEMHGKDLIDSVKLSTQICRILGAEPPIGMVYELFLDQYNQKISKSKGNGLTIEEWLTYAPSESLAFYMYQSPKKAKQLYFGVIPRCMDEYLRHLNKYPEQLQSSPESIYDNPVWHVHNGKPPKPEDNILNFSLLLNLASVCNTKDEEVLWGFVERYLPSEESARSSTSTLGQMIKHAVLYYQNHILPHKQYRQPTAQERDALVDLKKALQELDPASNSETIQGAVFEVGKKHNFSDLRIWFQSLYQLIFAHDDGPRMGSFIQIYGIPETILLIDSILHRSF